MMNTTVILPAAGIGKRFAIGDRASASKIEFEIAHKPTFLRAIDAFYGRPDVGQILLAVHPDRLDEFSFRWADKLAFLSVTLIPGSKTERWATVKAALDTVTKDATHIAIHDAARPCPSPAMIDHVFDAAERFGAAVPGLQMSDTVKYAEASGVVGAVADPLDAIFVEDADTNQAALRITGTLPRNDLYRVQTPQVFERSLLMNAYASLNADDTDGITDDASVVECFGEPVYVVEGDPLNLKLTQGEDAELLEAVIKLREEKDARTAAVKELFGDDDDD